MRMISSVTSRLPSGYAAHPTLGPVARRRFFCNIICSATRSLVGAPASVGRLAMNRERLRRLALFRRLAGEERVVDPEAAQQFLRVWDGNKRRQRGTDHE